jgi:hypothetical protein
MSGRGRAVKTYDLIDIMIAIAETIKPCTVRGIAYKLLVIS